jgi:hypothetical protein
MLFHPVAAIVVIGVVGALSVAFVAHLAIDYVVLRLRP